MYIDIVYIQMYNKSYESKKVKTSQNFGWKEYIGSLPPLAPMKLVIANSVSALRGGQEV